ncbi:MAG: hypothetical protein JWO51_4159, partial [Rhodospirillales bacterium]|nr:hypothetical protein [Rhodospirillales bacterium]MDB5362862.1 hypothetical protein [Rhodospirillales bacterium]
MPFGLRLALALMLVSIAVGSLGACSYIRPDNNPNIEHH